jgi:hypothetical protein
VLFGIGELNVEEDEYMDAGNAFTNAMSRVQSVSVYNIG